MTEIIIIIVMIICIHLNMYIVPCLPHNVVTIQLYRGYIYSHCNHVGLSIMEA